eukprot:scaffold34919_cov155-Amphora_coffeaeformis.AAC.2
MHSRGGLRVLVSKTRVNWCDSPTIHPPFPGVGPCAFDYRCDGSIFSTLCRYHLGAADFDTDRPPHPCDLLHAPSDSAKICLVVVSGSARHSSWLHPFCQHE